MRISVALCTYNGENYLEQQLESIVDQTRQPDELIVFDDASTDGTMMILAKLAKQAPFSVHIERNQHNLGSTRNFEKAIRRCSGDIIALCDQDDLWLPHKLARISEAFRARPEAGLVFSDADLVNESLQPLRKTMWQTLNLDGWMQERLQGKEAFSLLLKRNYVTGALMAFRSVYLDQVLPISPLWVHDGWIAIIIAAQARFALIPEPLVMYRQHATNQIGATHIRRGVLVRSWASLQIEKEKYWLKYRTYADLLERLEQLPDMQISLGDQQHLHDKVEHTYMRTSLLTPRPHRLRDIVKELARGRYQTYSVNGFWSALRDVVYLLTHG